METNQGAFKYICIAHKHSCSPYLFFLQVNYTLLGEICNLWRNYDDIQDSWDSVQDITDWFFDNQEILQPEAGPGRWNDPDMVCPLSFLCLTIVCPLLRPIPLSFFLCSPLCSCLILYSPQNCIGWVFTLFHIYFGQYHTFIEACIHYLLIVAVLPSVTLTPSTSLVNIHLVPALFYLFNTCICSTISIVVQLIKLTYL